jgi:hypothetical protein
MWQWLAHPQRVHALSHLAGCPWPTLPVLGGRLAAAPGSLSSCTVIAPAADWPAGLADALQQLGCSVLDVTTFELPVAALSGRLVHSGDGPGVAAAIAAAVGSRSPPAADPTSSALGSFAAGLVAATAQAAGGSATSGGGGGNPGQLPGSAVHALSAEHRQALADWLLQERWYAPSTARAPAADLQRRTDLLVAVCQQLPLYKVAAAAAALAEEEQPAAAGDAGGSAGGHSGSSTTSGQLYVPLDPGQSPLCTQLAPAGDAAAQHPARLALPHAAPRVAPHLPIVWRLLTCNRGAHAGVPAQVLPSNFIVAATPTQAAIIARRLGISTPTTAAV